MKNAIISSLLSMFNEKIFALQEKSLKKENEREIEKGKDRKFLNQIASNDVHMLHELKVILSLIDQFFSIQQIKQYYLYDEAN